MCLLSCAINRLSMFVPARHFCGAGPMNRLIANTVTCTLTGLLSIPTVAQNPAKKPAVSPSQTVLAHDKRWIGTWATAPQPFMPGSLQSFRNQSLRLIVHTSAGGTRVRIKISNTFGDHPLLIGGAHIARRTATADIDPTSDRILMFHGRSSTTVPARSMVVSDPVELDVPALSDLAISLFLPKGSPNNKVASIRQIGIITSLIHL